MGDNQHVRREASRAAFNVAKNLPSLRPIIKSIDAYLEDDEGMCEDLPKQAFAREALVALEEERVPLHIAASTLHNEHEGVTVTQSRSRIAAKPFKCKESQRCPGSRTPGRDGAVLQTDGWRA